MNITTLKKFLTETNFVEVDYRVYSPYVCANNFHPTHGGWHCYSFTTYPANSDSYGDTLMIKLKDKLFDSNVVIYKNGTLVGHSKGMFLKWRVKKLIKKAFTKHFDEVIEKWNNKTNKFV